ncbi:nucleoside phosphorylase domain-containing protein, partial [Ochromonadaceae sp. CCMP2298]
GGFKCNNAAIGDAFLSTQCVNHDRRIPIPGFTEYGEGSYVSLPTPQLQHALGFKSGVVTTSNSLDHVEMDDTLMKASNASVKDMEAAAIAYVCELASVPFFAVKVVTDIVDGDRTTQEEFFENLAAASASLQDKLPKVLDFVVGKKLSDL